jgi:hypothetical protein
LVGTTGDGAVSAAPSLIWPSLQGQGAPVGSIQARNQGIYLPGAGAKWNTAADFS